MNEQNIETENGAAAFPLETFVMPGNLVKKMKNHTDCNPWYWASFGEKCYSFGVVEAFPWNEKDDYPDPGSKLEYGEDGEWYGENGTKMMVDSHVMSVEEQNGDTICQFIASAHANIMGSILVET